MVFMIIMNVGKLVSNNEQWLVVVAPGNEIATWISDEFIDK